MKFFYTLILSLLFLSGFTQNFGMQWTKTVGGTANDQGNSIITDQAGNVYTTGFFSGSVDLDPGVGTAIFNAPFQNCFISKLDAFGNFIWAKTITGNLNYGTSINLDALNNLYISGNFINTIDLDPGTGIFTVNSGATSSIAGFILKLDFNGNFVWGETINTEIRSMTINQNNIYCCGSFMGIVDFDPGPGVFSLSETGYSGSAFRSDAYALKIDLNGQFLWAKKYGGLEQDVATSITTDNQNNIIITGDFESSGDFDPNGGIFNLVSSGFQDVFTLKSDPLGNLIWANKTGGLQPDRSRGICTDIQGNILLTGYFASTVDFDPGITTLNFTSAGGYDIFVQKLNSLGNLIWAKQMGGSGDDIATAICTDLFNNIYTTGAFSSISDFDPGLSVFNITSNGFSDVFVSQLSSTGGFKTAFGIGSSINFDGGFCIKSDGIGNIYLAGYFWGMPDFDPSANIFNSTSNGLADVFIEKLNPLCPSNSFSTINVFACDSYVLNNQTYTTAGVHYQTLINTTGCDSLITLNLSLGNSKTLLNMDVCGSYIWQGQTLTNSGIYRDTLLSTSGCDSILELHLTIRSLVSTFINISLCEGQVYAGYTLQGIYINTFIAVNGCDSIRTLNLTVKPKKYSTVYQTICNGNSFSGYSLPGIYVDTFASISGCDSIRTLDLSINPVYSISINKNICEGQTYLGHSQSGTYTDKFFTVNGCDSILITNLIVDKIPRVTLGKDTTLCLGEKLFLEPGQFQTYLWQDGSTNNYFKVSEPGQYLLTVTNGCGSATAKKNVRFEKCLSLFPNAFTPNGDDKNDLFRITNGINLNNFNLQIFNRYGERVFETNSSTKGWDGTFKNIKQDTGAFTWQCTFSEGNNAKNLKGTILLLR